MPQSDRFFTPHQARIAMGLRAMNGKCVVCGNDILMMCRKGTLVCSENCEKKFRHNPDAEITIKEHHASE